MTDITLDVPVPNTDDSGKGQLVSPSQPANQRAARQNRAMKIVNKYVLLSGGVGLIPAPFFDQVAIAGLLAKMLSELCQVYQTKWSEHKIKTAVASVLGGAHSDWITYYITNYLNKLAPGINVVGGIVTRPIIAGAITYTIGKLFVHHLNSGAWLK
jgi:uncharacterized protein (DUF697 family)